MARFEAPAQNCFFTPVPELEPELVSALTGTSGSGVGVAGAGGGVGVLSTTGAAGGAGLTFLTNLESRASMFLSWKRAWRWAAGEGWAATLLMAAAARRRVEVSCIFANVFLKMLFYVCSFTFRA